MKRYYVCKCEEYECIICTPMVIAESKKMYQVIYDLKSKAKLEGEKCTSDLDDDPPATKKEITKEELVAYLL